MINLIRFIVFIFIGLYAYSVLSVGVKQIQDNWPEYRCNPMYMPFSEQFGQDPMDNFSHCVQGMTKGIMSHLMEPMEHTVSMLSNMGAGFQNSINNMRHMFSNIRDSVTGVITNIFAIFLSILIEIQKMIMDKIDDKFWVIMFRRAMIKLSCLLGQELNAKALITGENIGQVSSQTLSNMQAISSISNLPILRPLAGHNKEEIIKLAQEIGTYEDSIAPHQDCCSFFLPLHPELKANTKKIENLESKLNDAGIYKNIISQREVYTI